jgi:hypothetical protein
LSTVSKVVIFSSKLWTSKQFFRPLPLPKMSSWRLSFLSCNCLAMERSF